MWDFFTTHELSILRWLHIVAMVYWLGGEWGVFQTSYKVVNPALSLEERSRHMETAYRIDIMARTGIISLLPLGLHMGHIWGIQPLGGPWLVAMWILWAVWMVITWGAFAKRGTQIGMLLSHIEDWTRYILIPVLIFVSISSLLGHGPFAAGEGQRWYSAKILTYGLLLILGVVLRLVMHEWRALFPILAQGPNPEAEHKLKMSIRFARGIAYLYWVGILTTAFFGAVKPF
ncbi:hypothetical protein HY29_03795 [Hyphomonas beringensis]|uniref:Urate oxidase N-terminal domain-containing protein n=1 Tax=Hyphomonas beringensis TaxID=1280946 RepID=A0A062U9S7_9PROT|nr:hypothetical protein [Hyphomonas beringensis]KCZ53354.1 hypothetical protein HY29_03795 [Hyphomonas beringensis]